MTLLSELGACLFKARPGLKEWYEALPDARRHKVDRKVIRYLTDLVAAEYAAHLERSKAKTRRSRP